MAGYEGFTLWFYGGIGLMLLAVLLFLAGLSVFLVKRKRIGRKMDEEYGQPQKYKTS